MPRREKKTGKTPPRRQKRRTPARPGAGRRAGEPLPFIDDITGRRLRWDDPTTIFSGPRAEAVLGGLEPAFLLFDSSVMQALRARAAQRGIEYDTLVRMIVREHVDEY
jgi:hypothetical protein